MFSIILCTMSNKILPYHTIPYHTIGVLRGGPRGPWPPLKLVKVQGRPQDLGGGGQEFFFSDLGICMSRSDMLRMAKPCALLGGFGGMPPRERFFKRCNLVRFRVYFDQILSLFFSKNAIFYIKNK